MTAGLITGGQPEAGCEGWRFGTKAETLDRLGPLITEAQVPPLRYFQVRRWRQEREQVLDELLAAAWADAPLIVRSSTLHEDDPDHGQAGRYDSISGVRGRAALARAVDEVIDSYGRSEPVDDLGAHQVLVQPQVEPVRLSGVMFTCDPNTRAPYLVINYEESGDSAAVTSGSAVPTTTFYGWKESRRPLADARLERLAVLAREIEAVTGHDCLDIEFAFDHDGTLHLLQVRPLPVAPLEAGQAQELQHALQACYDKVAGAVAHPTLLGGRAVYGVMPDWNPAEIIGVRPRPLALSLYRRLITDQVWADQRHRYGYRDVRGCPLMVDFMGLPYIDVRASFNSLVPADLPEHLAGRLVDFYLDRLAENPALHDKVEFAVVHSCYTFSTPDQVRERLGERFGADERQALVDSLRRLTNALLDPRHPARRQDQDALAELERRWDVVKSAGVEPVAEARWLLEDCGRLGTPAFAGFARLGFIAVELLRSLVAAGVFSERDVDQLMAGLDTVTNRMAHDQNRLEPGEFLRVYGHLRPGTYDIRSPRYDEAPELYFDWPQTRGAHPGEPGAPFRADAGQLRAVEELIRAHGLQVGAEDLVDFITTNIAARENSKFLFTRHLSEVLTRVQALGAKAGLDVDECSYLDIRVLEELYQGAGVPQSVVAAAAASGQAAYRQTQQLMFPPLITEPGELLAFHYPPSEPNYITHKTVTGPVEAAEGATSLEGKILLLPSGDPGFDWIFSHRIAGFVTQYGGANSHMAIRAHQFDVPAVIGAGEGLFQRLQRASLVRLDCANRRADVIR
ncbi:PEP/pyruvate-binding domain-containing protein [Streptacidiphilus pinicola]|uniref:PEP/pyruvate-binding domain-containing protein n=1 Tax=Streptacidiphilus pinicola TaxID=2219663 RepID=UPI0014023948|nr:PEP/pyruvate-binding domain-containing protein [Streptacidiphilus pinicola]